MKMYKLEVYVIDFEDYGIDNYITELKQLDCGGLMTVKAHEEADIGEWHDLHPFNNSRTPVEHFREYFEPKKVNMPNPPFRRPDTDLPNWRKEENKAVTEYCLDHYINKSLCSLCANTGIIDTRNAVSSSGVTVGRRNWCICPNGQAQRIITKTEVPSQ